MKSVLVSLMAVLSMASFVDAQTIDSWGAHVALDVPMRGDDYELVRVRPLLAVANPAIGALVELDVVPNVSLRQAFGMRKVRPYLTIDAGRKLTPAGLMFPSARDLMFPAYPDMLSGLTVFGTGLHANFRFIGHDDPPHYVDSPKDTLTINIAHVDSSRTLVRVQFAPVDVPLNATAFVEFRVGMGIIFAGRFASWCNPVYGFGAVEDDLTQFVQNVARFGSFGVPIQWDHTNHGTVNSYTTDRVMYGVTYDFAPQSRILLERNTLKDMTTLRVSYSL